MSSVDEAAALNQAIADEAPVMVPPTSGHVRLLRGLHDTDADVWHDTALVRELNGADEERLAEVGSSEDIGYSEWMGEVLKLGVLKIGDLDPQAMPALLDKLILADRDMLFLAIVKKTYGRTKHFSITCQSCGETSDIEIDMDDDFIIISPEFDIRNPLTVETSKGEVQLKLPTGESASKASKEAKTDAEINSYMLASSVVDDSLESFAQRLEWSRGLSLPDRRKLVGALNEVNVGPKMGEVETHCAGCEKEFTVIMDWVSLLLA